MKNNIIMVKHKRGKSKRNIGLIETYNFYHNRQLNQNIPITSAQEWYPKSIIEQEYYILLKTLELNHGMDNHTLGLRCLESYKNIAIMYLTYQTPEYTDSNGIVKYDNSENQLNYNILRAEKRFDEMHESGLLTGSISHPGITIKGVEKLNKVINYDEDSYQKMLVMMQEIINTIKTDDANLSEQINAVVQQLDKKTTVKECIETVNDIANLITHVNRGIQLVPALLGLLHPLLQKII